MELVRDRDDDRVDRRVREHFIVVTKGDIRTMDHRHPRQQVFGDIADRIKPSVASAPTRFKMRCLRDRPAAEYADIKFSGRFIAHGVHSAIILKRFDSILAPRAPVAILDMRTLPSQFEIKELAMAQMRYLVADVDRAVGFYTKRSLCSRHPDGRRVRDRQEGRSRTLAQRTGELGRPTDARRTKPVPGGWNRFVIEVADIEESTAAHLKDRGAVFRGEIIPAQAASNF